MNQSNRPMTKDDRHLKVFLFLLDKFRNGQLSEQEIIHLNRPGMPVIRELTTEQQCIDREPLLDDDSTEPVMRQSAVAVERYLRATRPDLFQEYIDWEQGGADPKRSR